MEEYRDEMKIKGQMSSFNKVQLRDKFYGLTQMRNKGLNTLNFVPHCQANHMHVDLPVCCFNYMSVLFELDTLNNCQSSWVSKLVYHLFAREKIISELELTKIF